MARHDDDSEPVSAPRRLRVIPLTTTMLGLMLVIQINEIYNDGLKLRSVYGVSEAAAEDKPADAPKKDDAAAKKDDAKPAEDANSTIEKKDDAKPEDAKPDAKKDGDAKPDDAKKSDAPIDPKTGKPMEEPRTYGTGKSTVKEIEALKSKTDAPRFSQNEIDLLENLSKRREELDTRDKELTLKAKVLEASEKRIDDKIAEMKTLNDQLSKTVALYNEKQDTQIKSLVKIYESMKPIQAAQIFDQLDMPILLEVIDKMSERKVAPVLAQMDPKKAKEVTEQLAAMRKANSKTASAANGATTPKAPAP